MIFNGVTRMLFGFNSRKHLAGWRCIVISGLISTAIGVYFFTLMNNPEFSMSLLGIFVGVSLLFEGFSFIFIGTQMKKVIQPYFFFKCGIHSFANSSIESKTACCRILWKCIRKIRWLTPNVSMKVSSPSMHSSGEPTINRSFIKPWKVTSCSPVEVVLCPHLT